jgi:hypothetical protein
LEGIEGVEGVRRARIKWGSVFPQVQVWGKVVEIKRKRSNAKILGQNESKTKNIKGERQNLARECVDADRKGKNKKK